MIARPTMAHTATACSVPIAPVVEAAEVEAAEVEVGWPVVPAAGESTKGATIGGAVFCAYMREPFLGGVDIADGGNVHGED